MRDPPGSEEKFIQRDDVGAPLQGVDLAIEHGRNDVPIVQARIDEPQVGYAMVGEDAPDLVGGDETAAATASPAPPLMARLTCMNESILLLARERWLAPTVQAFRHHALQLVGGTVAIIVAQDDGAGHPT